MKTIEITVPKEGISTGKAQPKVDALGYTGQSCKTATEAYEACLGAVMEDEIKPELYETEEGVERLKESEGNY
jgi:hypothetical protein